MTFLLVTVGSAVLISLAVLPFLHSGFQAASSGWRLLAISGVPLSLGGLGFAVRFWHPTSGPYLANQRYPYGGHLNAWAVSFGFTWLAFGLLFAGLVLLGSKEAKRAIWVTLLASWLLCWLPHGVIGIAFAWAGHNEASISAYRAWGGSLKGAIVLLSGTAILLAHFTLSLAGFVLTGRELWRTHHGVRVSTRPG